MVGAVVVGLIVGDELVGAVVVGLRVGAVVVRLIVGDELVGAVVVGLVVGGVHTPHDSRQISFKYCGSPAGISSGTTQSSTSSSHLVRFARTNPLHKRTSSFPIGTARHFSSLSLHIVVVSVVSLQT